MHAAYDRSLALNRRGSAHSRRGRLCAFLLVATVLAACGDDAPPVDGGVDSEVPEDASTGLPQVDEARPAELPNLSCPAGWESIRESGTGELCAATADLGPVRCEGVRTAFTDSGRACRNVGSDCEAPFPRIDGAVYVAAGGTGQGSREAPYGTLEEALASGARAVLIDEGEYALGEAAILDDVNLVGRCPEGVRIVADDVAFRVRGDARLENLSVVGGSLVVERNSLSLHRAALLESDLALDVEEDGRAFLERVLVRQTSLERSDSIGVRIAGSVEGEHVVVRGFLDQQITVEGRRSQLRLQDSVIGASVRDGEAIAGDGIRVGTRASAVLTRVEISSAENTCLRVVGTDAFAECTSCAIGFCGEPGVGVSVRDGGRVEFLRSSAYGSRTNFGVVDGSFARVVDSVFAYAISVEGEGVSVLVDRESQAELHRVMSSLSLLNELRVESQSSVMLEDVTLVETNGSSAGAEVTSSLLVRDGAQATVDRVFVRGGGDVSVRVRDGVLEGSDLHVERSLAVTSTGIGAALMATGSSRLALMRATIRQGTYVGAFLAGPLEAQLSHLRIDQILPSMCLDETCASFLGGIGLGVYGGAQVDVERFRIERALLAGVQLASGDEPSSPPSLDLRLGSIQRSEVGIHVDVPDYDVNRLLDGVVLENNMRNLDTGTLPLAAPEL